jgi:tetratricopeptide (TPR) repeat protein
MAWRSLILMAVLAGTWTHAAAHEGPSDRVQTLTKSLEAQPNNAALFLERAQIYRQLGQSKKAMADVNRAGKILGPEAQSEIHYQRGLIHRDAGRHVSAEKALTRALRGQPDHGPALEARAVVRVRRGRLRGAIADYTRAIARRPTPERFLARGALQERQGHWKEAAEGYEEGMEGLRGPVSLRIALIRVETQRKRYPQALALIDAIQKRATVPTEWLLRRGDVLTKAGRGEDASKSYKEALHLAEVRQKKRPSDLNSAHRAWAYLGLGQIRQARELLHRLAKRNPSFPLVQRLLKRL